MGKRLLEQEPIRLNSGRLDTVSEDASLVEPADIEKMSLGRYIEYRCQVLGITPEDVVERAGGAPLTAKYITFLMEGRFGISRPCDRRLIADALKVGREELEKRDPRFKPQYPLYV